MCFFKSLFRKCKEYLNINLYSMYVHDLSVGLMLYQNSFLLKHRKQNKCSDSLKKQTNGATNLSGYPSERYLGSLTS